MHFEEMQLFDDQQLVRAVRFAAVDFESAGAMRGSTDVPVQIGIACWSHEKGWEPGFVSYLHCPQGVSWQASRVHGITTSDLAGAPRLIELWPEIRARLAGAVVVAHARGTEKKFLRAFPGHGFGPWLDTLVMARCIWPKLSDHSLASVCTHANVVSEIVARCPSSTWHDAHFDATASLTFLRHVISANHLLDDPIQSLVHE